jgi:hypothetical protein
MHRPIRHSFIFFGYSEAMPLQRIEHYAHLAASARCYRKTRERERRHEQFPFRQGRGHDMQARTE